MYEDVLATKLTGLHTHDEIVRMANGVHNKLEFRSHAYNIIRYTNSCFCTAGRGTICARISTWLMTESYRALVKGEQGDDEGVTDDSAAGGKERVADAAGAQGAAELAGSDPEGGAAGAGAVSDAAARKRQRPIGTQTTKRKKRARRAGESKNDLNKVSVQAIHVSASSSSELERMLQEHDARHAKRVTSSADAAHSQLMDALSVLSSEHVPMDE